MTDPELAKSAKLAGEDREHQILCGLCGKLVGREHVQHCGKCGKEVSGCQLHRLSSGDTQGYYSPGTSVCPECLRQIKHETSVLEDEDFLS
jgi:hypothetical protein